jgi:hypothetical protein
MQIGERGARWLRGLALFGAVAALLAGAWAWHTFVEMENLHTVVPGELYRSGQPRPEQLARWSETLGLRAVLRLKSDGATAEGEQQVLSERGIQLVRLRLSGQRAPTRAELLELLDLLARAPRPLLVHCDAGADRTGLAVALALLQEGRSPSEARRQFGLRYRHLGAVLGSPLADVLDEYAAWLAQTRSLHSPERLRAWISYVYVPDHYLAYIEADAPKDPIPPGRALELRVSVRNASPRAIPLAARPERGAALGAVLSGHPDGLWWAEVRDESLEPGETRELFLELPPLEPGAYELRLDLAEDDGSGDLRWFQRMGSPPFVRWIHVSAIGEDGESEAGERVPAPR